MHVLVGDSIVLDDVFWLIAVFFSHGEILETVQVMLHFLRISSRLSNTTSVMFG